MECGVRPPIAGRVLSCVPLLFTDIVKLFFGIIFLDELENFPLLLFDMVIDILKESLNLLIEVLVGRLQSRDLREQFVDVPVFL